MKIVVFGSKLASQHLANFFSKESHQILALSSNSQELLELSEHSNVTTVCGSPLDSNLLKEINSDNDTIFLALSKNTGDNLSACFLTKTLGYKKAIALISEKEFFDSRELNLAQLFLADYVISPQTAVSRELIKHILYPETSLVDNFANGTIQLQTHVINENWQGVNKPLSNLEFRDRYLAILIKRDSEKKGSPPQIIYPRGNTIIQPGDEVTFIGKTEDMTKLHEVLGKKTPTTKNVCICGTSFVTATFAKLLQKHHISLKIIESNLKTCEKLSRELPFATVIHHDEMDKEFLIEENISSTDVFIASSSSTEKNLQTASTAQDLGCKNIISLVSNEKLSPLFSKLNLPFVLSEQSSFYNQLCSNILGTPYSAISDLYPDSVKIVETQVSSNSNLKGKKISEIENLLPKPSIVAIVKKEKAVEVARGSSMLNEGDFVVAILDHNHVEAYYKLF